MSIQKLKIPCAALGAACLAGTLLWCLFGLEQAPAGMAAALLLLALAGLALLLLRAEGAGREVLLFSLLFVGLAVLLRAFCLDHVTYDYRDFLSKWAAFFRENGGFAAIKLKIGDYNAPYLYFMAAISYLPFPDLYAIKLFSVLFDVLLAWGGLRVVSALRGRTDLPSFAAFWGLLLLPTVVLNGAYWAQCDSIYGALLLHAVAAVLRNKNKTSVALLAVAFSFKLQTIFVIPLWGVLWLAGRVKFRELLVFPAAYAATVAPALLLGKPLADILSVYFNQAGQYTYALVFNAPTAYALLPWGLEVNAPLLSKLGILLAFALCLGMLFLGWRLRGRLTNFQVLAVAAVLAIGVPFLLPYMHDRYFFAADVITLCLACAARKTWPVAALTQGASLSAYSTYLRLSYTLPVTLFGMTWVMGLDALAMLSALACAAVTLKRSTHVQR